MTVSMEELASDKAIVCRKEHRTNRGIDDIMYVLLSDGWLLDCGTGNLGSIRAKKLAALINRTDPSQFSHSNMGSK